MRYWWHELSEELIGRKQFDRERTTVRALSARFHAGRAVSILSPGFCPRIEAYAALWYTADPTWYELEIMKRSSDAFNTQLLDALPTILDVPNGKRIFLVSDDAKLICRMARCGFVAVNRPTMPDALRWASRVHAVAKIPPSVHSDEHPTPGDGQKWLLVR